MLRLQGLLLPLVYAPRRGEVHGRPVEVMWCTVARWHVSIHGPLRWPNLGHPLAEPPATRIMARLECRYGDMTQSRLTCPVIRSGDGQRAGTARLGREPTTYRLICVHDSVAAYSHLTRRRLGRRQTWAVSDRMRIRCVTGAARRWSVDVEYGLAADAAVQQGVERWGGFAPGAFELNLAVEAAVGDERA